MKLHRRCLRPDFAKSHREKLELIFEMDQDVPVMIVGDVTRLRQIVVNLLSNAVKFTNKGEIKVHIKNQGYTGKKTNLEVIEALGRQSYDVILMDLQMPEMDGLQSAREVLKRWPEKSQLPRIIALTANAMKEDRNKTLEAGMDDYVSKPINLDDITEALSKCHPILKS